MTKAEANRTWNSMTTAERANLLRRSQMAQNKDRMARARWHRLTARGKRIVINLLDNPNRTGSWL